MTRAVSLLSSRAPRSPRPVAPASLTLTLRVERPPVGGPELVVKLTGAVTELGRFPLRDDLALTVAARFPDVPATLRCEVTVERER